MKRKIVITEAAAADILEQADWYQIQSDQKLVQRWQTAVTKTVLQIVETPLTGALCQFNSKELADVRRKSIDGFRKHLIFYRVHDQTLLVLRVIHGARDLESLF